MKKKQPRLQRIKKVARKVHLVLGLLSGAVVFILALTGTCLSFQDEIRAYYTADFSTVEAEDRPFITASAAKASAKEVFPDQSVHGTIFGEKTAAAVVVFYDAEPRFYQRVYLNPYSGEVLGIEDYDSGVLAFALRGHTRLWLPSSIGSVLVSYSTLLFLFILISGLALWWPKNKRHLKQSLQFKWNQRTSLKRKIIQVHTVFGVYLSAFVLVFAITGSILGLGWFYFIVFKAAGGTNNPRFIIPNSKRTPLSAAERTARLDELIPRLQQQIPAHKELEIHYPDTDSGAIYVEVGYTEGVYYNADYRFFDPNTLEEIKTESIYNVYAESDFADKVIRMNYDTHVGAIFGLTGKIIVFFASFLIAILPLTGLAIWYKRRKEKKLRQSTPKTPEPSHATMANPSLKT